MAESDTAEPWLPDWFWDEPPPQIDWRAHRKLAKWPSFSDIAGMSSGFSPGKIAMLGGNVIQHPGRFLDPEWLIPRTPQHNTAFDLAALGALTPQIDTMGTQLLAGTLSQTDYRALEATILASLEPKVASDILMGNLGSVPKDTP